MLAADLSGAEVTSPARTPRSSVKLLTIGNSFADNVLAALPDLAVAGGKQLIVFRANLGGHSLAQHVGYLQAFEKNPADPKGRPYKQRLDPRTHERKDFSLREALQSEDWDFVTLQQVSNLSYQPDTYQPYAGILIDYIRKYAPHAEILIYQTWAYPDDYYPILKIDRLDQKSMYAGLKSAYQKLADQTGLRQIPVGDAFQAARQLAQPIPLNVPRDKHANLAGQYLGAAVFYEILFQDNVQNITASHLRIPPADANILRRVAHETVQTSLDKRP